VSGGVSQFMWHLLFACVRLRASTCVLVRHQLYVIVLEYLPAYFLDICVYLILPVNFFVYVRICYL